MFQKMQLGFQAFLSWCLGFIFSIFPFWLLIVALCFYDRYVGMKAAIVRGEKLQKGGLRRTTSKIAIYTGWVVLGGLFQYVFREEIPPSVVIPKLLAGMICVTEFDSIVFNISDYTGRDYRKLLLQRIPLIGNWIADRMSNEKSRLLALHKLNNPEPQQGSESIPENGNSNQNPL